MGVEPLGIHHVTAVASDPQRNADFYLRVIGMRLVKRTVNFDAPDTYHLYYGDEQGTPGTILTFFPWPGAPRGRRGTGQATTTSFAIPAGSLGWWLTHLQRVGVDVRRTTTRFCEECLELFDPDGLVIELVAAADTPVTRPWEGGPIPAEHAIRGLHSVTMSESAVDNTHDMLTATLGFRLVDESDGRYRYDTKQGGPGARVDVVAEPNASRGLVAAGTVHHVAWRAPDAGTQSDWRAEIVAAGVDVTPIIDRQYFESIYFREPGGVLLEIATDPPGFTKDEPLLELGRRLRLPPWLEPKRGDIQAALPALKVPDPQEWASESPGDRPRSEGHPPPEASDGQTV
ncbi:MAG: ring-cleaving dioxygenase [Actinomycetota bacterium]|nr:ring-cleaving dioxygenase [Actinomycetota bacterium]